MTTESALKERQQAEDGRWTTFPVIEIFGPTVQGEGPDAGRPAYFVRFGGCDYRCTWCDSMYAVEPAQVRAEAEHLDVDAILQRLADLEVGPSLVVLTGGNPALLELGGLVDGLQARGVEVAVETQGSVWRDWLALVDRLVVSPKPPSSQMATAAHEQQFETFMTHALASDRHPILKIVIFDQEDLRWAGDVASRHPELQLFLSAGTDVNQAAEPTLDRLLERYRWLCEQTARSVALRRARVLPQLHVLAWGTVRGV